MFDNLTHSISWIEAGTAWLLTYLLHSSVLLAAALVVGRLLPERLLAARETVWRTALVGGLLTATLQVGLAVVPLAGSWELELAKLDRAAAVGDIEADALRPDRARPHPDGPRNGVVASTPTALEVGGPPATSPQGGALTSPRLGGRWAAGLLAGWFAVATSLIAMLVLSYLRLSRRLGTRRAITRGSLQSLLRRLVARAGARSTRLACSDRISVPLARGLRRREICLPQRLVDEMPEERQEIVLAHELAHLERRDPAWLLLMRLLENLFFIQPLNRIARSQLQEIAEYRCDDRAVALTGRPITMARCLTDVAAWSLERRIPALVPSMAVDRSGLGRRVSRLLASDYPAPTAPAPRWLGGLALVLLASMVLIAPGVTRAGARLAGADEVIVLSDETSSGASAATPESVPTAPAPPAPPAPSSAASPETTSPPAPLEVPAVPDPPVAPEIEITIPNEAEIERRVVEALAEIDLDFELATDFEGIDPELEIKLEAMTKEIEVRLEQIEVDIEPLERELEKLLEEVEIENLESLEELEELERISELAMPDEATMARIGEISSRISELAMPDAATMARIGEISSQIAAAYQPTEEQMQRLTEATEELRAQALSEARQAVEESRREFDKARAEAAKARELAQEQGREQREARDEALVDRTRLEQERENVRQERERARGEQERLRGEAEEAQRTRDEAGRRSAPTEDPDEEASNAGSDENR